MNKGKFTIKKGQMLEDDFGRNYEARGRRDKMHKPKRGGGIKGAFRKGADSTIIEAWEANHA